MITDRVRAEVVECANPNCSNQYERPVGVRGRPQQYCSRLCGNFARLMVKAAAQPQVRPFTYAPAPNRAAPPIHETDAHATGGAIQSAHGHEALRRTPTESVTGATAHSTASTNNSQPTNTPKTGQGE
jgi:hypothetical protein